MTFKVAVEASDIEFPCEPAETILDAAERAGCSLPYSCRKGAATSSSARGIAWVPTAIFYSARPGLGPTSRFIRSEFSAAIPTPADA
jgi:hypothetical protein